ncbi:MAG TPA: glycosyltransferase, partial [Candidatus Polarisedimenticolia bacterium]|nr:glycosyltransferase [Candidatus Polarisedimenticolia bacterium]
RWRRSCMRSPGDDVRRLLVLAYFFPPLGGGGCQRSLKLVRYLDGEGWRSTVVTTKDRDYWILDPSLENEIPPSAEILRVGGVTGGKILRTLSRAGVPVQDERGRRSAGPMRILRTIQHWTLLPDSYRAWASAAERAADLRIRRGGVDAIWTTSSPESAHLAGLVLLKKHRLPWVADFRDPWVGRVTYHPPTAWHDARHRAMERRVVSSADRVTLVSEAMVALYRKRYPGLDPGKFVYLPNGFDPDDWRRADLERGGSSSETKPFVLLHAGQLAHRPTARTLLEAVRLLLERDPSARDDLRVRFTGGNEEIGPRERERYALGNVLEFRPSEPHIASLVSMRRAGALVLLGHGGSADALLYTGKLYEYLSSGRPILAILDEGPAATLIRDAGAGVVLNSRDVPGALGVLERWLADARAGKDLATHVEPGRLSALERQKMAARAARILAEIAVPTPR